MDNFIPYHRTFDPYCEYFISAPYSNTDKHGMSSKPEAYEINRESMKPSSPNTVLKDVNLDYVVYVKQARSGQYLDAN